MKTPHYAGEAGSGDEGQDIIRLHIRHESGQASCPGASLVLRRA